MKLDRWAGAVMAAALGVAGLTPFAGMAAAQTEADIANLVQSFQAAFNDCDPDQYAGVLHPDFSGFGVSGVLSQGRDAAVESFRVQCDAGLEFDMSFEMLESGAAFAATLADGTVTLTSGETVANPLRVTFLFDAETSGGPLLIRHTHMSALR